MGDPIVAIAAKTRDQARAAAAVVKVEYEPLPVILSPEEAMKLGAYQIHPHAPNNILISQPLIKGDAEMALKEAKTVI
jgi:CO/xanthine dehydrogenase Mo-binding subunit